MRSRSEGEVLSELALFAEQEGVETLTRLATWSLFGHDEQRVRP
jgi:hypothetical protein